MSAFRLVVSVMSRSNLCSARNMLVFVYGTLKSGQPNHNLIKEETRGTCVSVGTAVTREKYPLVVASRYNVPYLLYKPGTGQVREATILFKRVKGPKVFTHIKKKYFEFIYHMDKIDNLQHKLSLQKLGISADDKIASSMGKLN